LVDPLAAYCGHNLPRLGRIKKRYDPDDFLCHGQSVPPMVEDLPISRAEDRMDRISRKYTGEPYPLRTDRIILLLKPDHARSVIFC
jgi:Berberine and berberine like